jgi:hypothetical protein
METKQLTAVERLFIWCNSNPNPTDLEFSEAFNEAKEMEKEQIMKVAIQSYHKCILLLEKSGDEFIEYAKECYEETFESELETI